jgi:hypothetical protein
MEQLERFCKNDNHGDCYFLYYISEGDKLQSVKPPEIPLPHLGQAMMEVCIFITALARAAKSQREKNFGWRVCLGDKNMS